MLQNSSKYRIFFFTMIFAFLWVIIGDLVAMHIRIIADVEISHQSPFTKVHKSDKKTYKDSSKKNENGSTSLINFFICEESLVLASPQRTQTENSPFILCNIKKTYSNFSYGRAPPIS